MLERLKWPGAALLLGVLGALVRRWQTASAFEGDLRLPIPNAPASWAMAAFFALAGVVLGLLAFGTPVREAEDERLSRWDTAFAAGRDAAFAALTALAVLLTLAAVPPLFREARGLMEIRQATGEGDSPLLQMVLAVCAVPGAFGLAVSALGAFQMKGKGRNNGFLLLPVLFSCVWLLEAYRAYAADPVLWDYVPLLVSVALGLLFRLECAGLAFSKGHPRRMLWLAGVSAALSCAALASAYSAAMSLLLAGQLLDALAALWTAPANLKNPPEAARFALEARDGGGDAENSGDRPGPEEKQEEDTNG